MIIIAAEASEGVKKCGGVGGELSARSKAAQIGVDLGGAGVVVTGAQMGVAAELAVGFAAHDEGDLAVGFVTDQAVDDMHACLFQLAGPLDVGGEPHGEDLAEVVRERLPHQFAGLHQGLGVMDRGGR